MSFLGRLQDDLLSLLFIRCSYQAIRLKVGVQGDWFSPRGKSSVSRSCFASQTRLLVISGSSCVDFLG